MTETQRKLNEIDLLEYGNTIQEVRKSICEFRRNMKTKLDQMDNRRIATHYTKTLDDDVKWMREILNGIPVDGVKIVNRQLAAAYFEYNNLWYKDRYLEVSAGLHAYDDWVAEYIHDLLVDGKKLNPKEIALMKKGNDVLYQMCVDDGILDV
jgi:hypothetical protein